MWKTFDASHDAGQMVGKATFGVGTAVMTDNILQGQLLLSDAKESKVIELNNHRLKLVVV